MTRILRWLAALGLAVAAASPAAASEMITKAGRARIDLGVGALAVGTDVDVDFGSTSKRLDSDQGLALGLGGGIAVFDLLDVSASFQPSGIDLSRGVWYQSFTAGARLYPIGRDHVVRPWLVGQGGWYRGTATSESCCTFYGTSRNRTVSESGGGVNIGAGFDVPLGRFVSVGTDLRYNQTIGVFDDPGYMTALAQLSFHFWR